MPDTADAILARFPGPVTLYVSPKKKLGALILCIGFTAFCVYLLVAERSGSGWYTAMAWFSTAMFGGLTVRAAILLLRPGCASLTLDADGFEIGHVFRRIRSLWRDASGFRMQEDDAELRRVMFEALAAGHRRGTKKVSRMLPDNYGLPKDELARLLAAWRERALARVHHAPVPH